MTEGDEVDDEASDSELFRRQVERERQKTAHHEGGHLAVGWALGATLSGGDIIPRGTFGGRALYTLKGGRWVSPERVISILAGPAAQRRFAPREDDGGEQDYQRVAAQLADMCPHPTAAAIVRRHCQAEADRLVGANWDAIEAIAGALLERDALSGEELDEILADVTHTRSRRSWAATVARAELSKTEPPPWATASIETSKPRATPTTRASPRRAASRARKATSTTTPRR